MRQVLLLALHHQEAQRSARALPPPSGNTRTCSGLRQGTVLRVASVLLVTTHLSPRNREQPAARERLTYHPRPPPGAGVYLPSIMKHTAALMAWEEETKQNHTLVRGEGLLSGRALV